MILGLAMIPAVTRGIYNDMRRHLSSIDGVRDLTVTDDPINDNFVLQFEVLGQMEKLVFSSALLTQPSAVAQAVWSLRQQRLAAVGPEFHMYAQLAQRSFAPVDPYGRPV